MMENIEIEILELRGEISSLTRRTEMLDRELAPVWEAERRIRELVKATHGRKESQTLVFDPVGREMRAPLFEELLAIAVEHGPVKAARFELAQRSRAYQRRIDILQKEWERSKRKKPKEPPQGSLF